MKQRWRNSPTATVVVILALTLGLGFGMLGLLRTADFLSVRAGERTEGAAPEPSGVSGSDTVGIVTSADLPHPTKKTVGRQGQVLFAMGDPDAAQIPFTMTHDLVMDDGTTVTTAYPSSVSLEDGRIWSSGEEVTYFNRNQRTVTGTLVYGKDMNIYVHGGMPNGLDFFGEVRVKVSDGGDDIVWPCGSATAGVYYVYNHSYVFYWNKIADKLEARNATATAIEINMIQGVDVPNEIRVVRHHENSRIRLEAADTTTAWGRLFGGSIPAVYAGHGGDYTIGLADTRKGVTSMTVPAGTEASYTVSAARGTQFYLSEVGEGMKLLSVTARSGSSDVTSQYVSYDAESGRYLVKMPAGNVLLDVHSVPVDQDAEEVHKITVRVTSDDYSLHTLAAGDSYNGSYYSDYTTHLRYADQACTNVVSNGAKYPRLQGNNYTSADGKTVSFVNYHVNQNVDWYTSLVAYSLTPDEYFYQNNAKKEITEIYDLSITRDSDGEEVKDELGARVIRKSGSPCLVYKPPAYDITVSFKVRIMLNMHHIYVHDKRPTTMDTVYCHYVNRNGNIVYVPGTPVKSPSLNQSNGWVDTTGNNASYFPSDKEEKLWDLGMFETGLAFKYGCYHSNGCYDYSTLVKSWKVYKADASGQKTGAPLEDLIPVGYDDATELSYEDYAYVQKSPEVCDYTDFVMPDYNIVIEAEYCKTVGSSQVVQQIANADGTVTPAGDDFSVSFVGTPRDDETPAFVGGDTRTITGAKGALGIYSYTHEISFTVHPAPGYVVSYVQLRNKSYNNDLSSKLTRDGDTFTIPEDVINYRWASNGAYGGNGVSYWFDITYTKVNTLTVKQSVDGDLLTGSSAQMAKITLSSRNNGTFIDPSITDKTNLVTSCQFLIKKSERSSEYQIPTSNGNLLTVDYRIEDSGRVLSELKVYETATGNPLAITKKSQSFNKGQFYVDAPVDTDVTIEAVYKTVNRIRVSIVRKNPDHETASVTNDTDVYATVAGTGSATESLGYQFKVGSTNCDSFEVHRENYVEAQTTGSTTLSIDVLGLEDSGYIVANVDATYMDSNGNPGTNSGLIEARNDLSDDYGTYLNFEHCTLTMPDKNMFIRIYLAKTAQVTVNFNSRMGGSDTPFSPNQVSSSVIDMTHTASGYGNGVRPVTIVNGGNKYNGSQYTITSDPSSRTVTALEQSRVSGVVNIPEGYLIASVVTRRTDGSETETVGFTTSDYKYTAGGYEASFRLNAPLQSGWDYTIDVNIETATRIRLEVYHSDQNGAFRLNTVTDSYARMTGSRGGSDAAAPYNQIAYQSTAPFAKMSGSDAGMVSAITADKQHNSVEYYVLRNTAFSVTAFPAEGDEFFQIKVVNAEATSQTYPVTAAGTDANGNPVFTLDDLSQMGDEMVVRVYFTDTRTFGIIGFKNYDISGSPITVPSGAIEQLTVTNNIYTDEPAYDLMNSNAPVKGRVKVTGQSARYRVTVGSSVDVSILGAPGYRLYCYRIREGEEERGPYYLTPSHDSFGFEPTLTDGSEVTVICTFIRTASVSQSVYYNNLEGDYTDKMRFRDKSGYDSLYFSGSLMQGENPTYSQNMNTDNGADRKEFAAGENSVYSLRIRELAGYTLRKLVLSCGGYGDWELTRDQITDVAPTDYGDCFIDFDIDQVTQGDLSDSEFTKLRQCYAHLMASGSYGIKAYFGARFIHVRAYDMSPEEFEQMQAVGITRYMQEHSLSYHSAQRVVDMREKVGEETRVHSVDGSATDQYFETPYSQYALGVRYMSHPKCNINSLIETSGSATSIHRTYYRIGAVLYGASELSQSPYDIGSYLPLSMGIACPINLGEINSDRYLTVIYVRYHEEETLPERPVQLVNQGTVVDQSSLSVYIYEYDEATSEKKLVTDPAELAKYDVRFDVEQECVGYYSDTHSESSNQSNSSHHANYQPAEGEGNVYHHDTLATVIEFINGSNAELVGPMAKDGEYAYSKKTYRTNQTDPAQTVHIDHVDDVYGRAAYGIKTNNIDKIKVSLNATLPENVRLEKMEVQRGDASSPHNQLHYEYNTAAGEDVKVIYVFSRPNLSISTNNEPDANGTPTKPKGSVNVITSEGPVVGLTETDKKQSIRFNANKELILSVEPMTKANHEGYDGPDYELDYVRVTDSSGNKTIYRASNFIGNTLNIGSFSKDIDVLVQFRQVDGEEKATLNVNKYFIDAGNNIYPLTEKCQVTIAATNDNVEKPLKYGAQEGSSFAFKGESSLSLEVKPETDLRFTLGDESGYKVAPASIHQPFQAKTTNGSAVSDVNFGSQGTQIFTVSKDYAVDGAILDVDVYFVPAYRVYYDGNGQDSGVAPTDEEEYVNGTELDELPGKGNLKRRGFSFGGWSTRSGSNNGDYRVESVIFQDMDIHLYAIWTPLNPLHVYYDGMGNTGGDPPEDTTDYYESETVHVMGRNNMVKSVNGVDYAFAGWDTDPAGTNVVYVPYDTTLQNASGTFNIQADTTLYAVWRAQYRVTYRQPHVLSDAGGHGEIPRRV